MTTRSKLVEVFRDTLEMMETSPDLVRSLGESAGGTKLYREEDSLEISTQGSAADRNCKVTVTPCRTFEAARNLIEKYPGRRVGVLNFASATSPGGGVVDGAFAQEECLCRCSTLYPVLNADRLWKPYYEFHYKRRDSLYTDACIYTPGVKVIKSDVEEPERLPASEWYDVDVITCAAPNLRYHSCGLPDEELLKIHLKRGERILKVAIANHVDVLVLGAFGCGAFRNNPKVVAEAYRELLEKYRTHFTAIEFAVFCREGMEENFLTFQKVLG